MRVISGVEEADLAMDGNNVMLCDTSGRSLDHHIPRQAPPKLPEATVHNRIISKPFRLQSPSIAASER